MPDGSGDALHAAIVESHHAAVRERQLYLPLALLTGYLARHRAVHLVGQPVFTGHGLHLQHALKIFSELLAGDGGDAGISGFTGFPRIIHVLIVTLHGVVAHHRLWRMAKHLGYIQVEWLHPITLPEREVTIAGGLTNYIERCAFALSYLPHMIDMLLIYQQPHALLTLIGDDFLRGERLVANGQLSHVNLATALLDKLRQTVQVARRAMVMDGDHGIDILLTQRPHQVIGPLLHLWIGTLHGVQLYAIAIPARVNR